MEDETCCMFYFYEVNSSQLFTYESWLLMSHLRNFYLIQCHTDFLWILFISFFCVSPWLELQIQCWIAVVKYPCLVPDIREKAFCLSALSMMLAVVFYKCLFSFRGCFPLLVCFWKFLSWKGDMFSQMDFLHGLRWPCDIFISLY